MSQLTRFARGFVYAYNGIRAASTGGTQLPLSPLCGASMPLWRPTGRELPAVETALIALCVAAVLALELVNSAIERAVDKPDTTHWWTAGAAKDMAAGAVLVMAHGYGHCSRRVPACAAFRHAVGHILPLRCPHARRALC